MGFLKVILLSIFLAFTFCSSTDAYNFLIGGKNGWTLHPSENYNQWSGRMRFLVNDTLSFKYANETDSVLVVSKDDYEKCNAANPISKLDGGDSTFSLYRSGPFYFITGNKTNCDQGQKLIIRVLAIRNKSPPTPSVPVPVPSPAPGSEAPVPSPESHVPAPSPSVPVPSPAPAPGTEAPTPSPESNVPAPSPSSEVPAVSPAPVTSGPANSPLSPGNSPADISSPPGPSPSFAPAVFPAVLVSVLLSLTVAAFITFN